MKKTIVEKIYEILKKEKTLKLTEIYTRLPEHSKSSIRGNINRHIASSKTKLFVRVSKAEYALNEELESSNKQLQNVKVAKVIMLERFRRKRLELFSKIDKYNSIKMVSGMEGQISLFDDIDVEENTVIDEYDEAKAEYGFIYRKVDDSNSVNGADDSKEAEKPVKNLFSFENMINKVMHMDAVEFLKSLPDKCVDLLVTDPPYRCQSGGRPNKKGQPGGMLSKNDGKIFKYNDIEFEEWIPEVFRVMKDNTQGYIMTNLDNLDKLMNICKKVGFKIHNLLVWKKNNVTPNRWYLKNCEYTLFVRKGKAKSIHNKSSKTVHEFKNILGNKLHKTEKPIELANYYVQNSLVKGGVLLDPFCGLGAFVVSGLLNGMNFLTCELDPEYVELARKRVSNAFRLGYDDRNLLF